jgi:MFS family permease
MPDMNSAQTMTTSQARSIIDKRGPVATISIAQLFGTSLWFSANSAADDLMRTWHASPADIGWLTNAVQAGFILGTLIISLSGAADRFRASTIFVLFSVIGAFFNACFAWLSHDLASGALFRFCVGVSLAGIYPMGMKLIVSWAPERTGSALAQLIAMLTLGTALPHALRVAGAGLPWQQTIVASSLLALAGAFLIYVLGDGPHLRTLPKEDNASQLTQETQRKPRVLSAFRVSSFRAAALGYLGHMWELYTFWTLVPLFITRASLIPRLELGSTSGLAFCVIGIGAFGCLLGGALSKRIGSAKVAAGALALSGACCLIFAIGWRDLPAEVLAVLLFVWGASVIADSPQFSALAAKSCPPELVGSALAILNSLGFAITVASIGATAVLFEHIGLDAAWLLLPGPVLGLIGFSPTFRRSKALLA